MKRLWNRNSTCYFALSNFYIDYDVLVVSFFCGEGKRDRPLPLAISPEGRAVGENEAAYHVARMVTKDFGYYLKVKLPKRCTHVSLYREKLAPNYPQNTTRQVFLKGIRPFGV